MDLNKSIVIKSKFGTKSAGNYILRYTSREDATESLDIHDYITKYTPRYQATEKLISEGADTVEILEEDEKLVRKEGVMFGNRGLSYSDETLMDAARTTQKASDENHVVLLPILSFTHDYLKEKGLVDPDMPMPENPGEYKGKVDQLKLRMAITDMVNKMHMDMGFAKPEWTATIQFDTKHVHAHITSVETGNPKEKRMKEVFKVTGDFKPSMEWYTDDKKTAYQVKVDNDAFTYVRGDEIVAKQRITNKGNPKWYKSKAKTNEKEMVETGVINQKTQKRMRDTLNRSLSKTKDIKPFVKEITDKRRLTKQLTEKSIQHDNVTIKKLQSLQSSLPKNQKLWRANSNAKSMERSHEIANQIIDDIWTKYREGVHLNDFDKSVKEYIDTRQQDEKFDEKTREKFYKEAYSRLRTESLNALYKNVKIMNKEENLKDKTAPLQSIKSLSDDELKNEISAIYHDYSQGQYENAVTYEYRSRSYESRYQNAGYQYDKIDRQISEYDDLYDMNETSEDSKVVRDFYQKELDYHNKVKDKYAYINYGEQSGVKDDRFEEVKGTDLINMLYDYSKGDDRSVPREVASQYYNQTFARKEAINKTLDYLIDTGQYEQYELMRVNRDSIRKEADIAEQIQQELQIPSPKHPENYKPIDERKTIDTIQGRRLLKEEIKEVQSLTKSFKKEYETYDNSYETNKEESKEDLEGEINLTEHYYAKKNGFHNQKLELNRHLMEWKEKEEEEELLRQAMLISDEDYKEKDINYAESEKEVEIY